MKKIVLFTLVTLLSVGYLFAKEGMWIPILLEKYNLAEGKELGNKLKKIEEFWVNNNFQISEKEIKKIVNN